MMFNFLTLLTFYSTIALTITVALAYEKCYSYAEEYVNSCVNITGFDVFIASNVENSTIGVQLADIIAPEETEGGNFSLYIDVVPSKTEFSCPLVSRNFIKFGVLDDKSSQLELYFCYKSLPITVRTDLSANVQDLADCICAHFWFCRFDLQPTGHCSLDSAENCTCSDSSTILYTVDIKHPPDVFFEQEKCPNISECCLKWSSWSTCGKDIEKQSRYKYSKKKKECRKSSESRDCSRSRDQGRVKAGDSSVRNSSIPAPAATGQRHKKRRRTWKFIIMIVVAVVGLLITILLIAVIMLWIMKRKVKKRLVNTQSKSKSSGLKDGNNRASKSSKQKSRKRGTKHEAINESQVVSLAISTASNKSNDSGEEKASAAAAKSKKTTPGK